MQTIHQSNRLDFDRQFITSGWRGNIFRCRIHDKDCCLKRALSKEFQLNIQREIFVLEKIKLLWLLWYTNLLEAGEDRFICEWIDSIDFDIAWRNATFSKKMLLQQLLDRAFILDSHEIEHGELHRPMSNVLVDREWSVHVIDFDQWGFGNIKNKNLRHVMQWMMREKLISLEQARIFASFNGTKLYENLLQCKEKIVE